VCAAALAADLRMRRVVVPPGAGVFSAIGLLAADLEAVRSAAFLHPLGSDAVALMPAQFARLEQQALEELGTKSGALLRWLVELRYEGQGFALSVDVARAGNGAADASEVRSAFEREYQRTFGHVLPGSAIQLVALRVVATLPPPGGARAVPRLRRPAQLAAPGSRAAYFGRESGTLATPVLQRWHLDGSARPGPLIVEEYEGTTVVPPGASAARDEFDNIVITLG
jgi:N-methylhydantoinase A